jgi:outer membrane protein TolC
MQTKWNGTGQKSEFDYCNVNLRLDFPLFQGNYYKAYRQKAKLNLDIASLEKERITNQLSQQQNDWQTQYQTAIGKQNLLKDKVAAAADNLRIARLSMKEGVMEFDDFNNIFMDYNRARMEQIQNTADGVLYYLLTTQKF